MQNNNGYFDKSSILQKNKWLFAKYLLRVLCITLFCGSICIQIVLLADLWEKVLLCDKMRGEASSEEVLSLIEEMQYFPVQKDTSDKAAYYFENGYGGERSYGGKRRHEGIDIMSSIDNPGCLVIQSVSDGVIEQMGWLPLGGYRIGIRSSAGFYYYYAHLESYAVGLKPGKKVLAGEKLGLMGNTGYGKEGTRGKFAVHLHFGIYRQSGNMEESLNPYELLCYCSKREKDTGKDYIQK